MKFVSCSLFWLTDFYQVVIKSVKTAVIVSSLSSNYTFNFTTSRTGFLVCEMCSFLTILFAHMQLWALSSWVLGGEEQNPHMLQNNHEETSASVVSLLLK